MPHPPKVSPSLSAVLIKIPFYPCAPLPMCPINQIVKKMSSCEKDVKLSKRCQRVKHMDYGRGLQKKKKKNWHNEVHRYWGQFWHHIRWWPKTLKMYIESIFWPILMTFIFDIEIDVNMYECHCVNLFLVWTSSIVQMFDFLTFDIFLTNLTSFPPKFNILKNWFILKKKNWSLYK